MTDPTPTQEAAIDAALVELLARWSDEHPEAEGAHRVQCGPHGTAQLVDEAGAVVGEWTAEQVIAVARQIHRDATKHLN